MVSDVPVGVLLSGGIDSSLVVALLAEQGQTGLATFSIGFEPAGGESGDEFEYSTLVAQRFGTDHHRIRIGNERLLPGIDAAVEIGRASCRERVEISVVAVSLKKKITVDTTMIDSD